MRHDDGFTLVELLVGITLVSVIGALVLTSIVQSLDVAQAATTRVDALTSLQQAQERMSRTIRAADPISVATSTSLQLTTHQEVVACTPRRSDACTQRRVITYTRGADVLTRREQLFVPASSATASTDTTTDVIDRLDPTDTSTFAFYDAAGTELDGSVPADIREVEITLRHGIADGPPLVLTTGVFLRNSGSS